MGHGKRICNGGNFLLPAKSFIREFPRGRRLDGHAIFAIKRTWNVSPRADYIVICDPWWNPAVEDQAVGRAHRMGQRRPVTVYRLVIQGSIEERIMALHCDKRALAEGLFGGESFGEALSLGELAGLWGDVGVAP